jgi:protein-tyrosine phosphatase
LTDKKRVLFVCLGNIVRSPLAENLFRQLAAEAGVEGNYEVDSAATSSYHVGEAFDPRMKQVAAEHGLHYDGRARQVEGEDLERFDLVIAMDQNNRDDLLRVAHFEEQAAKIHTLREFDPQGGPSAEVPDPYYGGIDGFETTYRIVRRACQGLLSALEAGDLES